MFRTAITDNRVIAIADNTVAFTYRRKDSARELTMTLSPHEFIRRFLMHVLPANFVRIRYYGFLSAACRIPQQRLIALAEMAQGFQAHRPPHVAPKPPVICCANCGAKLVFTGFKRAQRHRCAPLPRPVFNPRE